ncbi:translation initiation factor IF-2 [[Clostridium] sordellii]|uniref:Translation initiation factor IF-2 n=1 Tax=Paraclostridium sordellii TaxID=1505 RepID=A0A9P1L094_PARSO|nr:translation initiation factor IF-2 [Paeniclostridium sordellii]EPZ58171.1 translation initiation factor IF-2 [[Clostridium] sordellii VPI 9048] [Paeniclostridium sordellii VPI 9048]MCH1965322.1 translation initiation factor IF-2 [Paeniclostridium sordellii]MDU2146934.1 translation initiation factor IF-2 [Paeniclostridium sordellii]CEK34894.1 translation initiation factor IF-2,Translation initiation factor IF-2,translation initiation factor IF-2,EMAP domain,translation initiation factor IF-2,
MSTRVYQLAEKLGITSEELIAKLGELDINVNDKNDELSQDDAQMAIELLEDEVAAGSGLPTVSVEGKLNVQELANSLEKPATEIIMKLMKMGTMATINQELNFEIASLVAKDYGFELVEGDASEKEAAEIDALMEIEEDKEEDLVKRSPIVTVMGHVDHGKTSLLDAIRSTSVTTNEAGGITQHIGASEVTINGEKIVFLDTPGHEAFTSMRARGAQVTDMAILVVAADDGIMPQTIEAINHAKAAEVPIIVAINKIDKPGANIDRVKQELADQGLLVEDWGGDVISVPVSARQKTNIDTLLEMILLVAEVEELKANPNKRAVGTVIEAELDKGRGPVATVLVQGGTLKVGDPIVAGTACGKVRAMINDKGRRVKTAGPSTAVEILGLSEVPQGGDQFVAVATDKIARNVAEKRQHIAREEMLKSNQRVTLDEFFSQMSDAEVKELNLVVKADVQGSVQAVKQSLEKLSNEEVAVRVIHGGVGAVTESDVMLARASNAIIIGFNVRPVATAEVMAKKEEVDIRTYTIIYKAIEDVQAAMTGMLDPEYMDEDTGKAEVRETFKISGVGTVAGCYVLSGKIFRNGKVRVVRDGFIIHEGEIAALKRFKDDAKEVNHGYECGITITNFNDLKEGDIIEAYITKEVERKLK